MRTKLRFCTELTQKLHLLAHVERFSLLAQYFNIATQPKKARVSHIARDAMNKIEALMEKQYKEKEREGKDDKVNQESEFVTNVS